jgi:putative endonuclease
VIKSAKPLPELKRRVLTLKQKNQHNFRLGEIGEQKAKAFLMKKGYQILDKNSRFKNFEVDIVALDRKYSEIVFVEVKTRFNLNYGNPSLAVNKKKLSSLNKAALFYLKNNKIKNNYRFDIISVTPNKIEHFENVSWLG